MKESSVIRALAGRGNRGFALIIVLWSAALLSIIAASFALSMRAEGSIATNLLDRAQAAALAEAGIQRGILELLAPPNRDTKWRTDGTVYEVPFAGGRLRVSITSEFGKIDLNRAREGLILGLMRQYGDPAQAEALTDAILDWRDRDRKRRRLGAEDPEYAQAGREYGARDGAFLSVQELAQILGMNEPMVEALSDAVTVYSGRPRLDPTSASREALLAVPGLDSASIDQYLLERSQQTDETSNRRRTDYSTLLAEGSRYLAASRGSIYTVRADGVVPSGISAGKQAVIRITRQRGKPYSVLAWFDDVDGRRRQTADAEPTDGDNES